MPKKALTSYIPSYRYVGQAQLLTSKIRSSREYLMPTDNVIVLDYFLYFTKKSNLSGILTM